jgi:Ca2+-transporting ATPase
MADWYRQNPEEVSSSFKTDLQKGLSESEARSRLKEFGLNQLKEKGGTPLWAIFLEQFRDLMIIVLLAAAGISGLIGEIKDAVMILVIVFINAVLGTTQQYRAERAIAALKKLTVPKATVVRDGESKVINSTDLVPGDIILLEAGSYIPADIRIINAPNLRINEAALTGESVPMEKIVKAIDKNNVPIADQENMAFTGTITTYGRGKGIVVETGMRTQMGKIAELISQEKKEATPLQIRFAELGKWLAGIALLICFIVFGAGVLRGLEIFDMFLTAVSLAVAAIPEGLPAVITISLGLGAYRLVKRRAIIRKLPAVETLGSTTVICADKTGTLTQNKMEVQQIFAVRDGERNLLLSAAALCNDATVNVGDPTEKALVVEAESEGLVKRELERKYPRVAEIPFDSMRKMMSTLHKDPAGSFVVYTKGAVELLLEKSSIDLQTKERVLFENEKLVSAGKRVLGVALRRYTQHPAKIEESGLTFIGLIAMSDPPRPEVYDAVKVCKGARMRPIMVTGDHKLTALAIAKELGITQDESEVMTGEELETISEEQLREKVKYINVFARVSPEHKLKIVGALKSHGGIVAMTGDGVNDAPALKKADIGVAMGIVGTDVAREASDMVLTDDNFATIVSAIEEGRGIYDNIRKFIRYMLSTNSGEIFTMFFSILLRFPLPLLPIHILWVNMVTDGLPAVALSAEPIEKGIMQRAPRNPNESIFSGGLLYSMVGIGILMAVGTLWLFNQHLLTGGIVKARTVAFTVLALMQMAHVLNCRSMDRSLFKIGIFSNFYLVLAIVSTLLLQIAVVYVPFFQYAFNTVALAGSDWLYIIGIALTPIFFVELRKLIFSRGK